MRHRRCGADGGLGQQLPDHHQVAAAARHHARVAVLPRGGDVLGLCGAPEVERDGAARPERCQEDATNVERCVLVAVHTAGYSRPRGLVDACGLDDGGELVLINRER